MEDNVFNAWVAGFWEGEGSLYKRKKSFGYLLTITQTIREERDTEICLKKIQEKFGDSLYMGKSQAKSNYPLMRWQLTNAGDILYFLRSICPYCLIRKKDIKNAIKCYEDKNATILSYKKDGICSKLCVMD